jgi:hypothetical protein
MSRSLAGLFLVNAVRLTKAAVFTKAAVLTTAAVLLTSCTSIVDERPDESVVPPADHRPLPEAPLPLADTAPTVLASGLLEPRGMLLTSSELVVAERGGGRLVAVALSAQDAGAGATVEGTPRVVADELGEPWGVAGDEAGYFVTDRAGGRVLRILPDGSTSVLADAQTAPSDVARHADHVYWIAAGEDTGGGGWGGGAISRVLHAGGGMVEELLAGLYKPRGLLVTSEHVYFTVATSPSRLQRMALDGGTPEDLGSAAEDAYDAARDSDSGEVFWVTRSAGWPFSGWVNRTTSGGSNTARVVPTQAHVSHVALDATHVYWAFADGVHRFRRDGVGVTEAVALTVATGDLIVTSDAVYLSDRLSGRIYRRDK